MALRSVARRLTVVAAYERDQVINPSPVECIACGDLVRLDSRSLAAELGR
jgi:hypothetical protein